MPKRSLKNIAANAEDGTQRKGSSATIKSEGGLSVTRQASDSESSRRSASTIKVKTISSPSPGLVHGAGRHGKIEQIRFPKLEEYAHFHYDVLEIPSIKLCLCPDDASGCKHNLDKLSDDCGMFLVTVSGSAPKSWLIKRSLENFVTLDIQLHRCIFDRRFSHLEDLNTDHLGLKPRKEVQATLQSYLNRLSELAAGMINCGSVLSWMEMDNRGHRLVATDDSGINTPAIAAAHVIKRYNAQAADEISLQVGDMISVIDMPAAEDTIWWRGKRGFEVGFFPGECVEIIGDKVPTSMASRVPEPLATAAASRRPCEETSTTITSASSSASTPTLHSTTSSLVGHLSLISSSPESSPTMMKKHGKLLSFLRTFFSQRPPRNQLKQSGIVKERVFGCDLGEHLLNSGHDVPLLLKSCTDIIEEYGIVHGIYRLSGITSNIQKLRLAFDEDRVPDLTDECYLQDIHSISSLLKMYFRELPNPLLTYQLYDKFADAVRDEDNKLLKIHDVVQQLPPPHYRTTEYLMRHLARVAAFGHETEMHSKNLAIVWAPNLLRSKELEAGGGAAALQGVGIQAVVTECLICYCDIIFSDHVPSYSLEDSIKGQKRARPKSLAISTPTRLLSLEEARERAFTGHLAPTKFIDVGGGATNLPSKYHTVIDLPGYKKRAPASAKENKPGAGHKKTSTTCAGGGPAGWKSIFTKPRSGSIKKSKKNDLQDSVTLGTGQAQALTEEDVHNWKRHLRSAKSAESLMSSPSSRDSTDTASKGMQISFCNHCEEMTSIFQLSHKRSLSSDATAVLQQCYSTGEPHLATSPDPDQKVPDKLFTRDDSTRKPLHRRLPSAPNSTQYTRKSLNEVTNHKPDCRKCDHDVSIDDMINYRLLQVAEKTRAVKSTEELTSPLKRVAQSPPVSRKKARGTDGSESNELSADGQVVQPPRDITSSWQGNSHVDHHLRTLYSRVHDYAEILSDDEMGMVATPGSMSVSSSAFNMQDVLDQIDTRLALNAQLFSHQDMAQTSRYGKEPSSLTEAVSDPTRDKAIKLLAVGDSALTGKFTEETQHEASVNLCRKSFLKQEELGISPSETQQQTSCMQTETANNAGVLEVERARISSAGVHRTNSGAAAQISTLVTRRHTEFIPSATAAAQDLQNLNELLNSLEANEPQIHSLSKTKTFHSYKKSIPGDGNTAIQQQELSSTTSFGILQSQVPALDARKDGRPATLVGSGGGSMSKCLSVPSDIARSLENVTESQSDMLSSVTISELSVSVNSVGQDGAHGACNLAESTDPRHRRSTSLDSLAESDHLMTRTLREINSQMEAAFRHSQVNSSDPSLDSLSHHQRLVASDLDLSSSLFFEQRTTRTDQNGQSGQANGGARYSLDCKDISSGYGHLVLVPAVCSSPVSVSQSKNVSSINHDNMNMPSVSHNFMNISPRSDSLSLNPDSLLLFPSHMNEVDIREESVCKEDERIIPGHQEKQTHRQGDEHIVVESVHIRRGKETHRQNDETEHLHQEKEMHRQYDELIVVETVPMHRENETHRQDDEHVFVETAHMVKFRAPAAPSYPVLSQLRFSAQSDVANVCTNRSSSSSSSSDTGCEDVSESSLREKIKQKMNLLLPGTGDLAQVSTLPGEDSLSVVLPGNDFTQYQVVRRQHSPRVDQKSPRSFRFNTNTGQAGGQEGEDWKPDILFSSVNRMDDNETCERISSLCAAGLMSQRVRLSRESSISSLQSPESCYPSLPSASSPSPLITPVMETMPDLIQSTNQIEDSSNCPTTLHLALYHPDEFSKNISASVVSHSHSLPYATHNPPLPQTQAHNLPLASVVKKSLPEVSLSEIFYNETQKEVSQRNADFRDCPEYDFSLNDCLFDTAMGIVQQRCNDTDTDKGVEGPESLQYDVFSKCGMISSAFDVGLMTKNELMSEFSNEGSISSYHDDANAHLGDYITNTPAAHLVDNLSDKSSGRLEDTFPDTPSAYLVDNFSDKLAAYSEVSGESQTYVSDKWAFSFNASSGGANEESPGEPVLFSSGEEAQNAVNQSREDLMSPEVKNKPGQRDKSLHCLPGPLTSVGSPNRRTSISKIPRPRQNIEVVSPRSAKKVDSALHVPSVTLSMHVDTSPSSSSSSISSSSGHNRRGSETSGAASTKRPCHIRRSSDTKLTDLQPISPTSRCQSFSSNRSVINPRGRGSEMKGWSSDLGAKVSRIPLSHRIPSPQSHRTLDGSQQVTDALPRSKSQQIADVSQQTADGSQQFTDSSQHAVNGSQLTNDGFQVTVDVSCPRTPKQQMKVASPVPKPRKLSLNSKQSPMTTSADNAKQTAKTRNKGAKSKREGDTTIKKSPVVKDKQENSAAKQAKEPGLVQNKMNAVVDNQLTEQVGASETTVQSGLDDSIQQTSDSVLTQSQLQASEGGEKKTGPPVAARKFHFDSSSLPRWTKLLQTQISFPGQQASSHLYSEILGSRSSLDDSILQLAAERHDLFVPEITVDGSSNHCLGSLRVKRSQKMQSLVDLFERGSDSNIPQGSKTDVPGAHRVRTFSGSTFEHGGHLTPCVEVGRGDASMSDDDTFILSNAGDDKWSRERFPSRTGTGLSPGESTINDLDDGNQLGSDILSVSDPFPSTSCRTQDNAIIMRSTSHLPRTSATEKINHQYYPSLSSSAATSSSTVLQESDSLPHSKSRTRSESYPACPYQDRQDLSSTRPSSYSGVDLNFLLSNNSQLKDIRQASTLDTHHSELPSNDSTNKQLETARILDADKNSKIGRNIQKGARNKSEHRNSIQELRQLFERADSDSSNSFDIETANSAVPARGKSASPHTEQPSILLPGKSVSPHKEQPSVLLRGKSASPHIEQPVFQIRDKSPSHHAEVNVAVKEEEIVTQHLDESIRSASCQSSPSHGDVKSCPSGHDVKTCPSSHVDVKSQSLRLGPKPFYGSQK